MMGESSCILVLGSGVSLKLNGYYGVREEKKGGRGEEGEAV